MLLFPETVACANDYRIQFNLDLKGLFSQVNIPSVGA
jgi:hypothetical protein